MCGLCGSANTARFLVYSSDQAGGGLETRLCILFAQPVANLRLCRYPLPQTPTVVPIPGNLLLLMEYLDSVFALDSQADQDLDQQKHSAGSSERFVLHG